MEPPPLSEESIPEAMNFVGGRFLEFIGDALWFLGGMALAAVAIWFWVHR